MSHVVVSESLMRFLPLLVAPMTCSIDYSEQITHWLQKLDHNDRKDEHGFTRASPSFLYWQMMDREMLPTNIERAKEFRSVRFDEILYKTDNSLVASLGAPYGNFVIKYLSYCLPTDVDDMKTYRDPILTEALFLSLLRGTGISGELLYYSRKMEIPNTGDAAKLKFQLCANGKPIRVRYMITTKMGENLGSVMTRLENGVFPLAQAIEYGCQLITLIEKLHSHNIIHGDIHYENVVLYGDKLRLIDFEAADRIDPLDHFSKKNGGQYIPTATRLLLSEQQVDPNVFCHPSSSQWEMRYFKSSFRDDLYRVMLMIAYMIHGETFNRAVISMCNDARNTQRYMAFKESDNFFHFHERVDVLGPDYTRAYKLSLAEVMGREGILASSYNTEVIIGRFASILRLVRSMTIDSRPSSYKKILYALDEVYSLLGHQGEEDLMFEMDDF